MSRSTFTKALMAGLISTLVISPRPTWAGESDNIDDVRQELRQLRAQVQALRNVIAEFMEYDRQRASFLGRALKALGGPETPSPASPGSPARTDAAVAGRLDGPEATPAAPPPPNRRRPEATTQRRLPRPPRAIGTVRGTVHFARSEPVAYVYVENVVSPAAKGQRFVIEQAGKSFVPSWAVVQRGTTISFPNSDTIFHNVFSQSPGNSFDLGLYNSAATAKNHTFNESGSVDVYCNIHPQMVASVLVVPNRHFARVKANGSFEISGIPAGKRKIVAWSPGSRPTAEWVDVEADSTAEVNLSLEPKSPRHDNKVGQPYGSYE
jgi:plastocyanin